jgi:DNA-binding winged helix-turn-helix (wHTH) protein/tetratricopeptide (TPR) repeat protein
MAVSDRVELAHEPDFVLGRLTVSPSRRELVRDDGEREVIEHRVMQVLIALVRARGGIVTRDELIMSCWEGRVVGDDAIHRVLSRLRKVASSIGAGSIDIETITKIGYRLTSNGSKVAAADWEPAQTHVAMAGGSPTSRPSRRSLLIGAAAAGGLGLGAIMLGRSRSKSAPPAEARALYDRAKALQDSDQEDSLQAIAYLREAVRIAPDYGEAWGALALAYSVAIEVNEPPDRIPEFKLRLQEAARQAERFDPGNLDTEFALAMREDIFGQWMKAERISRRLVRRNPQYVGAHQHLAWVLMNVGRWNEAVDAHRQAKAINPNLPGNRYGLILSLWSAGRLTEADGEIEESIRRWPRHPFFWEYKIKILAYTGRAMAALEMINDRAGRPAGYDETEVNLWRAFLSALISRSGVDSDRAIKIILDNARRIEAPPLPEAFECAVLGRSDEALEMLEGIYLGVGVWAKENPYGKMVTHPLFQPQAKSLWGNPRFDRILNDVGLERYWRESGVQPDYRRLT